MAYPEIGCPRYNLPPGERFIARVMVIATEVGDDGLLALREEDVPHALRIVRQLGRQGMALARAASDAVDKPLSEETRACALRQAAGYCIRECNQVN